MRRHIYIIHIILRVIIKRFQVSRPPLPPTTQRATAPYAGNHIIIYSHGSRVTEQTKPFMGQRNVISG